MRGDFQKIAHNFRRLDWNFVGLLHRVWKMGALSAFPPSFGSSPRSLASSFYSLHRKNEEVTDGTIGAKESRLSLGRVSRARSGGGGLTHVNGYDLFGRRSPDAKWTELTVAQGVRLVNARASRPLEQRVETREK